MTKINFVHYRPSSSLSPPSFIFSWIISRSLFFIFLFCLPAPSFTFLQITNPPSLYHSSLIFHAFFLYLLPFCFHSFHLSSSFKLISFLSSSSSFSSSSPLSTTSPSFSHFFPPISFYISPPPSFFPFSP